MSNKTLAAISLLMILSGLTLACLERRIMALDASSEERAASFHRAPPAGPETAPVYFSHPGPLPRQPFQGLVP